MAWANRQFRRAVHDLVKEGRVRVLESGGMRLVHRHAAGTGSADGATAFAHAPRQESRQEVCMDTRLMVMVVVSRCCHLKCAH